MLTILTILDLQCDNCKARLSNQSEIIITDKDLLFDVAVHEYGWNIEDDKHLCPKCFDNEK